MADPVSLGISVAASVAMSLLSAALTPHPKPSTQDLTITSSAYGSAIPIPYGSVRVGCQLIWSDGLIHPPSNKNKFGKGSGGGKKGGGGVSDAMAYHANLAYSICEGPVDPNGLITIWANGIVIYDATGTVTDPKSGKLVGTGQYLVRFYNGSETQQIDPLIENYVNSVQGAGSASAFRGLSYLVIEGMNLTSFGNSIPTIHVGVTKSFTASFPHNIFTQSYSDFAPESAYSYLMDWLSQSMYVVSASGVSVYDVSGSNDALVRQVTWAKMGYDTSARGLPSVWSLTPGKYLIGSQLSLHDGGAGNATIEYFDLNSLYYIGRTSNIGAIYWPVASYGMQVEDTAGNQGNYVIVVGIYGQPVLWCVDSAGAAAAGGYISKVAAATNFGSVIADGDSFGAGDVAMCILGVPQEGSSNAYITPQTATSTGFGIYNCKANCFGEGTFSKLANVSLSSIGLTPGGNYQVTGLQVDLGDNGLIVGLHGITGTTGSATFKWLNGTVVWHTNAIAIGGDGAAGGTNGSLVTNGLLGFYDGAFRAFMMPTATGALGWDTNAVGFGSGTANSPTPTGHDTTFLAFDGTNRSVIMIDGNNYQIVRQFLGCGSGGPEGLDSIVSDILQRAGLTTSDFDVTALAAYSVQGYVVSKRSDAKQAIQQLSELFFFDCVESDTKLKFVVRGASPFISITQNDLGEARNAKGKKQNDSNYWKHTKKQEIETTEEFHVKFFDPYRNFQVGDQYYRRTGAPVATMDAKNIKILDVPLVMGPDQAAQIAQQSLFQEWVERDSYAASVGWKYLWMEPSDVATVTMNNGDVYTVRVDKVTTGLDLTMSCDFVATDSVTYTSTISGASGDGLIAPGSAVNTQVTTMMLLDLPLLRDADNPGDYNDLFYYGCIMTAGGTWPGGEVYRSTDSGATFAPDSAQSRTLLAGTVQGTLPVTYHPFMVDYSYTLTLFPYRGCSGTLTNATLDNVLSYNANALAINGEIIQFVNATLNSNGSYTLSGILRGCRGTEWMCNYHTVGEEWVYLDPTILANDVYTYAQVGMTWAYRATTFGSYVDAAPIKAVKLSGAALKPYPVVHFTRTISGSNLVIGWERRTRYSGGLMDGTGTAPLNEATEAYEIYILSSAYSPTTFDPTNPSTYVRKLTATTTQVTYTAAMMTADGFTAGSSPLYVVGYQISATVGRGFPGFDTVLAVP